APNAGNLQVWRFVIVDDEEVKVKLMQSCLHQDWMLKAPIFIVVCADLEDIKRYYPKKGEIYAIQDCSAATQNILLAATKLDINSCWVGSFDENAISKCLSLPNTVKPYAIITLGYSKEKQEKKNRYSINLVTRFNNYENREKEPLNLSDIEKKIIKKLKIKK
ncbi:nitroreductase family protein, partial [archaeon]|nr:nitroreductase family protein [archaeon]